ncbi:SRPBCC domain-containing protein [Gordonia phosphorivorans]|uniref:SRPBCC domain-containing protein n=1 Tax=Gordonia phosphorivorans TaxID=1056982 RepID=A0ABV6HA25_9ACTN
MPVIDVTSDIATCTLTIEAAFAAPVQRVWDLYADPRQLEKVWGPPEVPATFVDHDLTPGAKCTYFMTDPNSGEKYYGWWLITEVAAPTLLTFDDGFGDAEFNPAPGMPVSKNVYRFEAAEGGTRAVYTSVFPDAESLQQVLDMGMIEGATSAINQIDGFLAGA